MSRRILVVEDELDLLDAVTFALKKDGLKPIRAENGEEALRLVEERSPDLVLLDLMLPGLDGLEVCRRLRSNEKTARIPIIMVTAKAEETDAIIGLGVGADDYIRKPFGLKELVARVRAVLRRSEQPEDSAPRVVTAGELEVDPARHEARLSGSAINLTATEFRLLYHLVKNRGRVYTRGQLLERAVGSDVIVVERNIDVHVSALRRKLGEYGSRIETIRGVGYRFSERL
ncbi:MAG: response regulator [Planctomycetota bacterium]|jgi:DNA-binding response OmpR family regulator